MTTSKASTASPSPAAVASASPPPAPASTRKAWIKKTPVEIVLEQIGKQEEKVAEMRKDLAKAATGQESPGGIANVYIEERSS
jgi:hypothetical protein